MKITATDKIFLSIFFLLFSFDIIQHVSAQKQAWEELVEENLSIEKEIKSLINDTARLEREIVLFSLKLDTIKVEKEDVDRRISEMSKSFDARSLTHVKYSIDSLSIIQEGLKKRLKELNLFLSQKKLALSTTQRYIKDMSIFSSQVVHEQYLQKKAILNKRYSIITTNDLQDIINTVGDYSKYKDFEDYKRRIKDAESNKDLFEKAVEALQRPYDANSIAKIRERIVSKLEIQHDNAKLGIYKLSNEQFSEMDSLVIRLSRYKNGVKELKEIVRKVNNDGEIKWYRDNKSNKVSCVERIREIVLSQDEESVRIRQRYFEMIPYLNKLLKNYWEELKKDPFITPNETEKEIHKLAN